MPIQHVSESVQHASRPRLSDDVRVPRLRDVRHRLALSQEELAEASGVARSTIIKLEAGRDAWPSTVRKLAAALGVKPADLQD
jgi:transcriptional regulator with XRE-family HTH domain